MHSVLRQAAVLAAFAVVSIGGAVSDCRAQERSVEERLTRLEEHMSQQSAQNEQILRLLGNLAAQQGGAGQPSGPAQGQAQSSPAPASAAGQYSPGWVARIYNLPKGFDVTSGLPPSEIGHFNADKSGFSAGDFQDVLGVSIRSGIMWRGEAFLQVKQGGNYTFAMNVAPTCGGSSSAWAAVFIDGREIVSKRDSCSNFSLVGGASLEPGLYRVDFRFAPGVDNKNKARGGYDARASFDVSVKGPADSRPVPIADVLLRKVGN